MKLAPLIQRTLCTILSVAILFTFSACTEEAVFTQSENGNLMSAEGTEYSHLAGEGTLYYLGDLEFQGSVRGEEKISHHLGLPYQTGLFSISGGQSNNILIRRSPNNEWFDIYRKTSLPPFDFSVENCNRLEFVSGIGNSKEDVIHTTCEGGIKDKSEIAVFLSEIQAQKSPHEAGLYDLIRKPDGTLENCYIYAVLYGFFEEEPDLAIRMEITSYNDLAYSVSIEGKEYILPEAWHQKLPDATCTA